MKVLFVSSECYPLVKTGGLADVVGALPPALRGLGVEAHVLLPAYPGVLEQVEAQLAVARWHDLFGGSATLLTGVATTGARLFLLVAPHLFERAGGGPYIGPDGHDWPDNHLRFGALSRAAADIALGRVHWLYPDAVWRPDVVHLHDWQAALTAAYLHYDPRPGAPTSLLTIHNLAFQGQFPMSTARELGLPWEAERLDGLEFYGNLSFLKAGVSWCDHVSTVSPTYAAEIVTPEHGMGFDGLLRSRANSLTGIVNGIDDDLWNPGTDAALVPPYVHYSIRNFDGKAVNKRALQAELGLEQRDDVPLFCVVSRLTHQKGIDVLAQVMPMMAGRGAQFAVLGAGDRELEDGVRRVAENHPGRVSVTIGYDETLSHRMQAGSDAIVVPSRFEPCGLTQLYGLRYGTLPVVARVGGLADTVIDANPAAMASRAATGFLFHPVDADNLSHALHRACDLFADRDAWRSVQHCAMASDVGWSTAAAQYRDLYERIIRVRTH
ncbi:MAG: glycogen synthase GlgA [Ilumatobacteraceae bacterium]